MAERQPRPKKEPKTKNIVIRFSESEAELIKKAADAEDLDVSKFIRKTVLTWCGNVKKLLDKIA